MRCDPDPWAAFNLEQQENITFVSVYVPGFLFLEGKILRVSAIPMEAALSLNCAMELMRSDRSQARLPNRFLLSSPLDINLQDGVF